MVGWLIFWTLVSSFMLFLVGLYPKTYQITGNIRINYIIGMISVFTNSNRHNSNPRGNGPNDAVNSMIPPIPGPEHPNKLLIVFFIHHCRISVQVGPESEIFKETPKETFFNSRFKVLMKTQQWRRREYK